MKSYSELRKLAFNGDIEAAKELLTRLNCETNEEQAIEELLRSIETLEYINSFIGASQ